MSKPGPPWVWPGRIVKMVAMSQRQLGKKNGPGLCEKADVVPRRSDSFSAPRMEVNRFVAYFESTPAN